MSILDHQLRRFQRLTLTKATLRVKSLAGARLQSVEAFVALAIQQSPLLINAGFASAVLGAPEYGRVASANAFVAIFIALGSLATSVISYRITLLHRDQGDYLRGMVKFLRLALLTSGSVVGVGLALYGLESNAAGGFKSTRYDELGAAVIFVCVSVIGAYQQGLVLAEGHTRKLLVSNMIAFALAQPATLFVIYSLGYKGFFLGSAIQVGLRMALIEALILRTYNGGRVGDFPWRNTARTFMLPATLAGFTTLPSYWLASEILYHQPGGAKAFGIISVAIAMKQAPVLLFTSLISIEGKSAYLLFHDDRRAAYLHLLRLGLALVSLAVLFTVLARFGVSLATLASPNLPNIEMIGMVAIVVGVLLVSDVLQAVSYVPVVIVGSMWRSLLAINLPRDFLMVLVSLILIPAFNWIGFVLSLAISQLLGTGLNILSTATCAPRRENMEPTK